MKYTFELAPEPNPDFWPDPETLPEHYLNIGGIRSTYGKACLLLAQMSELLDRSTEEANDAASVVYTRASRMRETLDITTPRFDEESWSVNFIKREIEPLPAFTISLAGIAYAVHQAAVEQIIFKDLTAITQEVGDLRLVSSEVPQNCEVSEQHQFLSDLTMRSATIIETLDEVLPQTTNQSWRNTADEHSKSIVRIGL